MQKFRFDLYKNKNVVLVMGILFVHLFFALYFFAHDAKLLVAYNLCSVVFYSVISRQFTHRRVSLILTAFAFVVPFYTAEKSFGFEGFVRNVSITAGVSWFHKNFPIGETMGEADFLLYHGKKSGKNRVIYPTDPT